MRGWWVRRGIELEWVGLPGMRWLAPLVFASLGDVAGWSSWVVCIRVGGSWWWWRWGRLGAGPRLPRPGLAQAWAFARGFDNEEGGDEGGGGRE